MTELHDLVFECQDELVLRWLGSYEPGTSRSMEEVERRLRTSLGRLRVALLAALHGPSGAVSNAEEEEEASGHALDAVAAARAYGALHRCILDGCAGRGVRISPAEHRVLAVWAHGAVAEAVAAEQQRHGAESRRMAHDLRNPLGSALMALTLLRPRIPLADGARLADTLERNLKRLERVIDENVAQESTTERRMVRDQDR
jgi:signal transduction histidine kinase